MTTLQGRDLKTLRTKLVGNFFMLKRTKESFITSVYIIFMTHRMAHMTILTEGTNSSYLAFSALKALNVNNVLFYYDHLVVLPYPLRIKVQGGSTYMSSSVATYKIDNKVLSVTFKVFFSLFRLFCLL